ncbi:MAG: CotH kinase family protein [Pirellulaceae bacterium]
MIARSSVDFSRGSVVVLEGNPFTQPGRVSEWSFYSESTKVLTPLILVRHDNGFQIVGVGASRTSDGSGEQRFDFELQAGDNLVDAGDYFFGFKDGDNQVDESGGIGWNRDAENSVFRINGPLSGQISAGITLSGGSSVARSYSVQAHTTARLAGPFVTELTGDLASLYARYAFDVTSLDALRSLELQVRYDDGFVAYLNGHEVARRNAPTPLQFDSTATDSRQLKAANSFESINISSHRIQLNEGTNVLAVHALNESRRDADFVLDVRLNGIEFSSAEHFGFTTSATPGQANVGVVSAVLEPPQFSLAGGYYDNPVSLQISSPHGNAVIYYTTDGSQPSPENPDAVRYQTPLHLDRTTVLRAAAFGDDALASPSATASYLFTADIIQQADLSRVITSDATWGPQMEDSLKALPVISLVTSDTITVTGEVETSVEWIRPDGQPGFQINAGVEMFGGTAIAFPKRSLRLSFKKSYGPSKLEFDVFETPGGVTRFDQLLLRAGSHDTPFWTGATGAGTYIRNRWVFDRQLEMGQLAPRGTFAQVYLNGVYWGQYHLTERPNASFMAENLGGDVTDYDVLNAGEPIDGDLSAWNEMLNAVGQGYEELTQYLNVANYADYVLLQFFGGNNVDWRANSNWMAARRRLSNAGYRFFGWDSDVVLRTGLETDIVNYGGPGLLWNLLGGVKQYPEFLDLFADRIQTFLLDDGMLTAEPLRQQIDDLAAQIRLSVIAETARWGSGIYTPQTWEDGIQWIKDEYASPSGPSRAAVVTEQLRHAGLFPQVDAPHWTADGVVRPNEVAVGQTLELDSSTDDATIYYTLDGSDPRASMPSIQFQPLVGSTTDLQYFLPTAQQQASDWMAVEFDDSAWKLGQNGIGYDSDDTFLDWIATDVADTMKGNSATLYARYDFQLADPNSTDVLRLGLRL